MLWVVGYDVIRNSKEITCLLKQPTKVLSLIDPTSGQTHVRQVS